MRSIVQYAFFAGACYSHTHTPTRSSKAKRKALFDLHINDRDSMWIAYKGASLHVLASAHASLMWELLSAKHKEQNLEPDTVQPHICSFTQEDGMRRRGTHGAAYHHSHRYPAVTFKSRRQTQNLTGTISHSAPLRHFSTSNSRCEEFPKLLLE